MKFHDGISLTFDNRFYRFKLIHDSIRDEPLDRIFLCEHLHKKCEEWNGNRN